MRTPPWPRPARSEQAPSEAGQQNQQDYSIKATDEATASKLQTTRDKAANAAG